MPGLSDFSSKNLLNYLSGQAAFPALPSVWCGLFTAAPADDGTGGTEVTGGSYARVQVAGALTTNGTTAAGNAVLHFASIPAWVTAGMTIYDTTATTVIPSGTTVLSKTATTVTMSANATGAGVGGTDNIVFSAFSAAAASSGAEPATLPASVTNNAIVTFAQATANWGTVIFFGLFDASSAGNFLIGDYLGNFKWLPFSGSNASPSVLTSPAHGFSNSDPVVVTAKFGGTLPPTGGSWAGVLTVANATTDTFTAGVNSTGTGDGSVRKITQQSIPTNVTASFAAGQLIATVA
jgi:hypothetical protein